MIWLVKWLVIGRDGTFQIQKHLIWNAYYFKMLLLMKTIHYFQWGFVGHQLCVRSFWVPQGQKKEGRKEIYDKARQTIKRQRHHFPIVFMVKTVVFPGVMYRCESWTIGKAEHQRIEAFEMWYWRRLLIVSWAARRSNQSILKEISSEYSLEGLMLKL